MRISWRPLFGGVVWLSVLASPVGAQSTTINSSAFALHSTGGASGTNWTLDRDGYLGTYINLAAPGSVTIDVQAEGTASGGIDPNMNVVIADTKAGFDVTPGAGTYSHTYSLPKGTYFVRTEFNNDVGVTSRQLQVDSFKVTGATLSNVNDSATALQASDDYVDNFRKGSATVGMSGFGLVGIAQARRKLSQW